MLQTRVGSFLGYLHFRPARFQSHTRIEWSGVSWDWYSSSCVSKSSFKITERSVITTCNQKIWSSTYIFASFLRVDVLRDVTPELNLIVAQKLINVVNLSCGVCKSPFSGEKIQLILRNIFGYLTKKKTIHGGIPVNTAAIATCACLDFSSFVIFACIIPFFRRYLLVRTIGCR